MANLLERAIDCDDGDDAAKMIRNALGIASDEVANYVFPKTWPSHHRRVAEGRSSFPNRSVHRPGMTIAARRFPPPWSRGC
jgi:hypothetical protein